MKGSRKPAAVALLALGFLAGPGCAVVSGHSAPDGAWFDVTGHPTGGIPASLGYYGGVALLVPVEWLLGGVLPPPVDGPVSRAPGDVVGTGLGLVLGAPFHLLALPFGGGGGKEEEEGEPRPPY